MPSLKSVAFVVPIFAVALASAACGSTSDGSSPNEPAQAPDVDGGAQGGNSANLLNSDAGDTGPRDDAACAAASVDAKLAPVNLVFMLDESNSMWKNGAKTQRWTPVTEAMNEFFAAPESAGINASLQYFPIDNNSATATYCVVSAYATPMIPIRPLPDATTFAASIATRLNSDHLGTPTRPALEGALAYAATLKGKTAVVLATDGEPTTDCSNDRVADVAQVAANAAAKISTFVIGVGSATSLDTIAQSGGTGAALHVSVGDPMQTKTDLLAAIAKIRGSIVPCDIDVPAPPAGQTFALDKVNVELSGSSGAPTTFTYSADCKDPNGWHYDNTTTPTKIELCANACSTAKTQGGKLSVSFGCATVGGVPK